MVFNASRSARASDIVSVQGENFGTAPVVWLDAVGSTPATPLPVLNQVGTGWLAVQIPAGATGALALRISNGSTTSTRVKLNAATAHHLDAMQITPGGAFRIFGRNLALPGSTPTVWVDGQAASVNLAASDEHVLSVTAPVGLRASSAAVITVDNGNGSGASPLDRNIKVATAPIGDPLRLGVGWAAAYAPLMTRVVQAATDVRLQSRMACDGQTDDSEALQAALILASRSGGGVVRLPAGTCVLGKAVQLLSATVLEGAGANATELRSGIDSPIYTARSDLVALRNLTLTNTGAAALASLNLKHSSRLAVQGVRVNEGVKAMAWIYGNTDVVVQDSEFLQTGSVGATGAMHLSGNQGLVVSRNRIGFLGGIGINLDHTSDAIIESNTVVRDAGRQHETGVVHVLTVNFAHRIALVANSFDAINGPLDLAKTDGETILTEGGGAARTEGLGRVASATATSVTDPEASLNPRVLRDGQLAENFGIVIVAGTGAGQSRRVTRYGNGSFTIERPWDVIPDAGSRYATAVWGLEKAVIKDNLLSNNPRGILLYSTAAREIEIIGNRLVENGGILVRAHQSVADNWFSPLQGVRIERNTIRNASRRYPSHLAVHFANLDGQAVGLATIGVEVRRNLLVANSPNYDNGRGGLAVREGYNNQMAVTGSSYAGGLASLLGTVMQANTCTHCATAFRVGTGAHGSVLADNVLVDSGALWIDMATAPGGEKSIATLVR